LLSCSREIHMIRQASAVVIALVLNATPVFGQRPVTPATELIVATARADVHQGPTVASPVIGNAVAGTVLEIRRNLGSWVEVPWPNTTTGIAFVHVNTGRIGPRTSSATSAAAQASVAQINAVAAAAAAAGANSSTRAGVPVASARASQRNYVDLPSHRIGMGALLSTSNRRFGATARTWWGNRIGVQFTAARPQIWSADAQSIPSTQLAPSVLYSLRDGVTNNVWVRPYVGGGPRFYRVNLETGLGYEAFGGAEATLAPMPQFALGAELGYRWSRPSFNGFEPRKIAFALSGHWYVK
jgi:hypothetical protein